jgi:hypothetical protein
MQSSNETVTPNFLQPIKPKFVKVKMLEDYGGYRRMTEPFVAEEFAKKILSEGKAIDPLEWERQQRAAAINPNFVPHAKQKKTGVKGISSDKMLRPESVTVKAG